MAISKIVYKGTIVPLRDEKTGLPVKCRPVTSEDWHKYLEFLKGLREFLEKSLRLSGRQEDLLNLLADLITFYFRAPLLIEPFRGMHLSPWKAYLVWRIIRGSIKEVDNMSARDFEQKAEELMKDLSVQEIFKIIDRESLRAEHILTRIPADTRPGYNTSSLIIHCLAVSAIAWSLGFHSGVKDLGVLRLASLLHDLGKPLAPMKHVQKSVELAKELLSKLIPSDDLKKVLECIEQHHGRGSEYKGPLLPLIRVIREADRLASSLDRLDSLVKRIVIPKIKKSCGLTESSDKVFSRLYKMRASWHEWARLESDHPRLIERLTEEFAKEAQEELAKLLEEDLTKSEVEGIFLIKLDLGGIQNFIQQSEKLPNVSASSHIVDLAVIFNSIRWVQQRLASGDFKIWFPLECFLYTAGGNVLAISPKILLDDVENALKEAFSLKAMGFRGLAARVASAKFRRDFRIMMDELDHRLFVEKLKIPEKSASITLGLERKCEFCSIRPASHPFSIREEKYYVCEECFEKYIFFKERGHLKSKWEYAEVDFPLKRKITEIFKNAQWSDVEIGIMELIAGHDVEDIKKMINGERIEELRNLAVIKLDGNLAGAFMACSISLSDFMERSARIDISLKRAFRTAIRSLISIGEEIAYKEAARLILGLMYMGGDDALIFSPSWIAIPLAIVIMEEFSREMGYSFDESDCSSTGITLSIGIACAPAKHNIWMLLQAANHLLDVAKRKGRYPIYRGALAFDMVERGALSGNTAEYRMERLARMGLTTQPLVIIEILGDIKCDPLRSTRCLRFSNSAKVKLHRKPEVDSVYRLINMLLEVDRPNDCSPSELRSFYEMLFKAAYEATLSESQTRKRVKEVESVVRELLAISRDVGVSFAENPKDFRRTMFLYSLRQSARLREEGKGRIFSEIRDLILDPSRKELFEAVPLNDLILMIKMMEVRGSEG